MAEIISLKIKKELEFILKEIDANSLLENDESVIEGCYPIHIKDKKHYCLISDKHLIFAEKRKVGKPHKIFIYSFQKIETIRFIAYRHWSYFIYPLDVFLFSYWLQFMPLNESIISILFWTVITVAIILILYTSYYAFRGEDIIQIKSPGQKLNLRGTKKYKVLCGLGDIFFFENIKNISDIDCKNGNIKNLYKILLNYI